MPDLATAEPLDAAAAFASGYAAYGQLVKMLLPSSGGVAIHDAAGELIWCSDGYERPDLRQLIDELDSCGVDEHSAGANLKLTPSGAPAFVYTLRADDGGKLGLIAVDLAATHNARANGSMISSLLRPVLDCLQDRLSLERTRLDVPPTDRNGVELLLTVDEDDREDATALQKLVAHSAEHLGCALAALVIPEKNLSICRTPHGTEDQPSAALLEKTRKHLLAWAQLNNRPMVVNRVNRTSGPSPYKILSCPVRDTHDRVIGLFALFRSADAQDFEPRDVRILEFMARKAVTILGSQSDALTGLMNRLIFARRAQRALDDVSASRCCAMLYLDVDRLQAINDAFGFQAGDEVLRHVAGAIGGAIGDRDLASRLGGDRFAVLLPGRTAEQAEIIGRGVLAAVSRLGYDRNGESLPVSVSAGVSAADHPDPVEHVLAAAELACKRAKQQGRNRLDVYNGNDTLLPIRRQQLFSPSNLQDALSSHQFRLESQPICGLAAQKGQTVGYEILVRMRDRTGSLIAPDKFFEAAARCQLMPAIDRWVLCSSIELLANGTALAGTRRLTLNVSAQSLLAGDYVEFALEQLQRAKLAPELYCFELEEATAVHHIREAERFIKALSEAGCTVALDDFGRGLSSFAHLKRLPVQYLKIDGGFVRRLLDDRYAESMVLGISKAAKSLGLCTVGEHVESEAVSARLCDLGVDYGQGFYFGRPQPLATG